jgi:hypothetical protein
VTVAVRPALSPQRVQVDSWAWAARIPWLPDVRMTGGVTTLSGNVLLEAFGRQIGMLRAVATAAPKDAGLQLRFVTDDEPVAAARRVQIHLVGRGRTEASALALADLLTGALPAEFALEEVAREQLRATIAPLDVDALGPQQVAELRRDIDRLDPAVDDRSGERPLEPVLLPWTWSPQALLGAVQQLRLQPGRGVLLVHVEPMRLSSASIEVLARDAASFRSLLAEEENPLVVAGLAAYRRWLRELPRAALHLRLAVFAHEPLTPGLAEAIGVDLTRSFEARGGPSAVTGSFRVARPTDPKDVDRLVELLELRSRVEPDAAPDGLSELLFAFDPHEANTAFRLPITPEGGIPGVSTARLSTLPRGLDHAEASRKANLPLGRAASGGAFGLTHEELNRHLLVAGLPGSGKTTTVQTLLLGLADTGVPFLVIDPAKSDYRHLVGGLRAAGHEVDHVVLDPAVPAFNPFAVPPGSSPAEHAARVLAAFDAAFRFSELMPAGWVLLGRALFEAYDQVAPGSSPTLATVYARLGDVLRRAAYAGETAANLRAALLGRLEFLGSGPLGRSLLAGAHATVDWERLAAVPSVVELRRYTGRSERSLVFGLLLAGMISYREANPTDRLTHVTVLEEAHRLLGVEDEPASEGTRAFVDALAELRGSGEGLVVVEQTPSRLHAAVLKLTGTKVAHRVVERDERGLLGDAMLLEEHQHGELGRLRTGRAVTFTSSLTEPVIVDVAADPRLTPATSATTSSLVRQPSIAPLWCRGCPVMCLGSGGLRYVDGSEATPADRLLGELRARGATVAESWCGSAWIVAARHVDQPGQERAEMARLAEQWRRPRPRTVGSEP